MSENNSSAEGEARSSRGKKWRWIGGVAGTVLLAAIVAFASGLGTKAAEHIGQSEGPPVTYSVSALSTECFTGTFLPEEIADTVLERKAPLDWRLIEHQFGAAPVDRGPVQVAVQGESERTITLTGIEFHVKRGARPVGASFNRPCGGPTMGRALEVDLDTTPPQVVASSAEVEGMLGSEIEGRSLTKPITFPWTVSLTDPLLLEIIATTEHCYCRWTAEIPWVSGSKQGVIPIDNGGDGFTVVDGNGLEEHGIEADGSWSSSSG